MTSIRDTYKVNEIEGKDRTYYDLKSAIICSVIEHQAYWIDENGDYRNFINGKELKINIHEQGKEPYKFKWNER